MKDFLGRELNVGDLVAFSHANYTKMGVGRIVKFGKVQVILDCYYGYGSKFVTDKENAPSWSKPIQRYPCDVVKLEDVND
jgi:hypothetical protein